MVSQNKDALPNQVSIADEIFGIIEENNLPFLQYAVYQLCHSPQNASSLTNRILSNLSSPEIEFRTDAYKAISWWYTARRKLGSPKPPDELVQTLLSILYFSSAEHIIYCLEILSVVIKHASGNEFSELVEESTRAISVIESEYDLPETLRRFTDEWKPEIAMKIKKLRRRISKKQQNK